MGIDSVHQSLWLEQYFPIVILLLILFGVSAVWVNTDLGAGAAGSQGQRPGDSSASGMNM